MTELPQLDQAKILEIFELSGIDIKSTPEGHFISGHPMSLIEAANRIIKMSRNAVETQDRTSKYEWVKGSLWESITKHSSNQILEFWRKQ